ncbi:MAG: hypothetical protein IT450_22980 [Phycisphaerales bacterium]|nr:hypothetical protein [Phycisphaerales bacterium]
MSSIAVKGFFVAVLLESPLSVLAQARYYSVLSPTDRPTAQLFALSADGIAAVGNYPRADRTHPLLWTMDGGSIDLGNPTDEFGDAISCSGAGLVVLGFGSVAGSLSAWRWTAETGLRQFPPAPHGELVVSYAVSEDGLAVAGGLAGGSVASFRWTESGGYQILPSAGDPMLAMAISGDGSTVVGGFGYVYEDGPRTFVWRSDRGLREAPLRFGWSSGRVANVSYDGRFIGGVSNTIASRYDVETETLTPLAWGDGSPVIGRACAVSSDGELVVGELDNGSLDTFIWDAANGARDLDDVLRSDYALDVPQLRGARGISADGAVIAGSNWVVTLRAPSPYRGRPPCQGDVDGDQRVGLADLLFVLGEWRRPEPDVAADITGDGIVDQLDLNIVLVDFGDDCARRRIQSVGR